MMSSKPNWLPNLVCLEDYNGSWAKYVKIVYEYFENDFIKSKPRFMNKDVTLIKGDYYKNKHPTFWHIISTGPTEEDSNPDLRRCERIGWPRAIIENHDYSGILEWEKQIRNQQRVLLWLKDYDYLVILAKRKGYFLLWTAYNIKYENKKRDLKKEYDSYKKQVPLN